jgi:hypothetical protein
MRALLVGDTVKSLASLRRAAAGLTSVLPGVARPGGTSLRRLDDDHPRAWQAPRRERGVVAVPIDAVLGSASAPRSTRASDFLPTRGHRPADWRVRWERLQDAARTLVPLPPIEVLKAGDGYWVLDGHNRVAVARANGQRWIDADVTELVLPTASTCTQPISAQRGIT